MCRILAYSGPSQLMAKLIYEGERCFVSQSKRAFKSITPVNADGFGVGWFDQEGAPRHYRDTLPAWGDDNLKNVAHSIRAGLMFAHIRASTETETSRANCHPFIHQRWMFMHNGQIPHFLRLRRKIEAWIHDDDYGSRSGTTDSEAFFLSLFSMNLNDNPIEALRHGLHQVKTLMVEQDIIEPLRFTAVLSDGQDIYAIRYANDDAPPSLYYQTCVDSLLLVSEPTNCNLCTWHSLPINHALVFKAGKLSLSSFAP